MARKRNVLTAKLSLLLPCCLLLVASVQVVSSLPRHGASSLAFVSKASTPPSSISSSGSSSSYNSRIDTDTLASSGIVDRLRGGSSVEVVEEQQAKEEEDEDADDDNDEEEDEADSTPSIMSAQPVRLWIQTNWGNSVLDHRVELTALRTRNIASLKKSVSRQLPGRPPVLGLELVYEGLVLDDEMLVDELMEDDDDDEDEDNDEDNDNDDETGKVLILNIIPPVDPKFATELVPKLQAHHMEEEGDDRLTTEELVEAYFLNQAALARNSYLLTQPFPSSSSTTTTTTPTPPLLLLRLEMREQARLLREQLQSQIPEQVWEESLQPVFSSHHHVEERRGQRYRSGKGGARTNLRKSIQHNMNIVRVQDGMAWDSLAWPGCVYVGDPVVLCFQPGDSLTYLLTLLFVMLLFLLLLF
jgi:hypothetical protein